MTGIGLSTLMLADVPIPLMKANAIETAAPTRYFLVIKIADAAHALQAQIVFTVWLAMSMRYSY